MAESSPPDGGPSGGQAGDSNGMVGVETTTADANESNANESNANESNANESNANESNGARFSSINFKSSTREAHRLLRQIRALRQELLHCNNLKSGDFENFLKCLFDRDFYQLAASIFTNLRGETDPAIGKFAAMTWLEEMSTSGAARQYMPHESGFISDEYEVILVRKILSVFGSMIIESHVGVNKRVRVMVAKALAHMFQLPGIGWKVPDRLQALADEEPEDEDENHFDELAKEEVVTADFRTLTGLRNGQNTCYQSVTWVNLGTSEQFMANMQNLSTIDMHEDSDLRPEQVLVRDHVPPLLTAFWSGQIQECLTQLQNFWDAIKDLGPNSSLWQYRPGKQQDPAEFFGQQLAIPLDRWLRGAWMSQASREWRCTLCHTASTHLEEFSPYMYVDIPESATLTARLVQILQSACTSIVDIEKRCETCDGDTLHGQMMSFIPTETLPEIFIACRLFETDAAGNTRKRSVRVEFPEGAFPVLGPDALYYVQYFSPHVGATAGSGHYYAFTRPMPRSLLTGAAGTQEANGRSALKWTKWEDSKKEEGKDFEVVSLEKPYTLRLVPVSAEDVRAIYLKYACRDHERRTTISVLTAAFAAGIRDDREFDDDDPSVQALANQLNTIFEALGQQLRQIRSGSQQVEEQRFQNAVFTRLQVGSNDVTLSQDVRDVRALSQRTARVALNRVLATLTPDNLMHEPDNIARIVYQRVIGDRGALIAQLVLDIAHEHIRSQRLRLEHRAWTRWAERFPIIDPDTLMSDAPAGLGDAGAAPTAETHEETVEAAAERQERERLEREKEEARVNDMREKQASVRAKQIAEHEQQLKRARAGASAATKEDALRDAHVRDRLNRSKPLADRLRKESEAKDKKRQDELRAVNTARREAHQQQMQKQQQPQQQDDPHAPQAPPASNQQAGSLQQPPQHPSHAPSQHHTPVDSDATTEVPTDVSSIPPPPRIKDESTQQTHEQTLQQTPQQSSQQPVTTDNSAARGPPTSQASQQTQLSAPDRVVAQPQEATESQVDRAEAQLDQVRQNVIQGIQAENQLVLQHFALQGQQQMQYMQAFQQQQMQAMQATQRQQMEAMQAMQQQQMQAMQTAQQQLIAQMQQRGVTQLQQLNAIRLQPAQRQDAQPQPVRRNAAPAQDQTARRPPAPRQNEAGQAPQAPGGAPSFSSSPPLGPTQAVQERGMFDSSPPEEAGGELRSESSGILKQFGSVGAEQSGSLTSSAPMGYGQHEYEYRGGPQSGLVRRQSAAAGSDLPRSDELEPANQQQSDELDSAMVQLNRGLADLRTSPPPGAEEETGLDARIEEEQSASATSSAVRSPPIRPRSMTDDGHHPRPPPPTELRRPSERRAATPGALEGLIAPHAAQAQAPQTPAAQAPQAQAAQAPPLQSAQAPHVQDHGHGHPQTDTPVERGLRQVPSVRTLRDGAETRIPRPPPLRFNLDLASPQPQGLGDGSPAPRQPLQATPAQHTLHRAQSRNEFGVARPPSVAPAAGRPPVNTGLRQPTTAGAASSLAPPQPSRPPFGPPGPRATGLRRQPAETAEETAEEPPRRIRRQNSTQTLAPPTNQRLHRQGSSTSLTSLNSAQTNVQTTAQEPTRRGFMNRLGIGFPIQRQSGQGQAPPSQQSRAPADSRSSSRYGSIRGRGRATPAQPSRSGMQRPAPPTVPLGQTQGQVLSAQPAGGALDQAGGTGGVQETAEEDDEL